MDSFKNIISMDDMYMLLEIILCTIMGGSKGDEWQRGQQKKMEKVHSPGLLYIFINENSVVFKCNQKAHSRIFLHTHINHQHRHTYKCIFSSRDNSGSKRNIFLFAFGLFSFPSSCIESYLLHISILFWHSLTHTHTHTPFNIILHLW